MLHDGNVEFEGSFELSGIKQTPPIHPSTVPSVWDVI